MSTAVPTRLSEDEIELIRSTFKGNRKLLQILKKVFIPSYADPDTPYEYTGADVYADLDLLQIPEAELKGIVAGRQQAIKLVAGGIRQLWMIAEDLQPSPEELARARSKDSAQ